MLWAMPEPIDYEHEKPQAPEQTENEEAEDTDVEEPAARAPTRLPSAVVPK